MLSIAQVAEVDGIADTFITKKDLADPDVKDWERKVLGSSPVHRLKRIGRDFVDFETEKNLAKNLGVLVDPDPLLQESKDIKNRYFSQIGRNMLEMQLYEEQENKEAAEWLKKAAQANKLLRRKVKVSETEEGGSNLNIDQDWDTSSWQDEQICAGMDFLFYVFVDPKYAGNAAYKANAVVMIDRLLTRHDCANAMFEEKLEGVVARAISRFIKNGRSAAQLDLLLMLHVGRTKFASQLSLFNFAGRSLEMSSLEARLAAILIQHTFRAWRADRMTQVNNYNPITRTFGGDLEMRFLREGSVKARGKQLRTMWADFHEQQSAHERKTPSGFRGPCHLGQVYMIIILEMALALVEPTAGKQAQANREDLLKTGGSILLANFASFPFGPFASLALKVCSHICKVSCALQPMLEAGVVMACIRYMNFLETTGKCKWIVAGRDNLPNRHDMSKAAYEATQVPKRSFFDCILIITRLATHAAGVFRAKGNYDKVVPAVGEIEEIYYRKSLHEEYSKSWNPDTVRKVLGHKKVVNALTHVLLRCQHLYCMRSVLLCMYTIACSESHGPVLFEFVFDAGRLMQRILSLIEEEDLTIATLATCTFLQLATLEGGRDTMMCNFMPKYLGPYTPCTPPYYERKSYMRAIHINVALLRQYEWRAHDPETAPHQFSSMTYMRTSIYLDLLKTTRRPPLEHADALSISDLLVLPEHTENCMDFSIAAEMLGARDIAEFLVRPGHVQYVDELPFEEAVAGCVIIDALTRNRPTAASVFNPAVAYYLCRCLFILRWMFASSSMSTKQLLMVFTGVRAASSALAGLAQGMQGHAECEKQLFTAVPDLLEPAQFFVGNLTRKQPDLAKEVQFLQRESALHMLHFLRGYADIMVRIFPESQLKASLEVFAPIGMQVLLVVKTCKKLYEDEPSVLMEILDASSGVLEVLSRTEVGARTLSSKWLSGPSVKTHLPPPLSSSGTGEDDNYKKGLGQLTPEFYRLLSTLCQTNQGLSDCFSDGFLESSLKKINVLYPILLEEIMPEGLGARPVALLSLDADMQYRAKELTSCFILLSACANFTSSVYGPANDLILLPKYQLFDRLCELLQWAFKVPWNDLLSEALQTLVLICKDATRILDDIERHDVIGLICKILKLLGGPPEEVMGVCCQGIVFIASSLRNDYLKSALPTLREPLQAVSTRHPSQLEAVRGASWQVMRAVIDLEKVRAKEWAYRKPSAGINVNWKPNAFTDINDSIVNSRMRDLLQASGLTRAEAVGEAPSVVNSARSSNNVDGTPRESSTLASHSHVHSLDGKSMALSLSPIRNNGAFASIPDPVHLDKTGLLLPEDLDMSGSVEGTHFYCGPSSCGSLRLPDSPEHHGDYQGMSVIDNQALAASLPAPDERFELSQLSARDTVLREKADKIKKGHGFVEKTRSLKQPPQSPIRRPDSSQVSPVPGVLKKGKEKKTSHSHSLMSPVKGKHNHKPPTHNTLTVDVNDVPGFRESRPPVFTDGAFFC